MTSHTMPASRTTARVERFDTVIIGAGQAGLATAYHLSRGDADYVVLGAEPRVGDNWRRRWDTLRLFTPARYSGLPGVPFPAPPYHLPDKDEMADYLERYADRLELPVRMGTQVLAVEHTGTRYVLDTVDARGPRTLEADNVIVAAGAFQSPRIPLLTARLSSSIHQLHSSGYTSPFALPDGPALVVGAGNSGAQIALELARHRKVWLAGRDTGRLPRRLLGRDIFDWLWPLMQRATADSRLGKRIRLKMRRGGDGLIGMSTRELVAAGIRRVGRVDDERGGFPVVNGEVLEPSVMIWCTGFHPDYRWIRVPVFDDDGYPRHERGVVSEAPGLFFVGLRFQYRMNSSLIGGVGADAQHVAERVLRRMDALQPA
jgi:putative flavoprotein involved in K+ transport